MSLIPIDPGGLGYTLESIPIPKSEAQFEQAVPPSRWEFRSK